MRILFVGGQYRAFHRAIRELGHDVVVLDYWHWFGQGDPNDDPGVERKWWPRWDRPLSLEMVNYRVLGAVKIFRPHALVVFKGWRSGNERIMPGVLHQCRLEAATLNVYWSVDDPDFLGDWNHYHNVSGAWDVALTCCRASVAWYHRRATGVEAHYFLPGFDARWECDPDKWDWLPPNVPCKDSVDLVITGTPYHDITGADLGRARVAVEAVRRGLSVELYGPESWMEDQRELARQRHGPGAVPMVCGDPSLRPCYRGWTWDLNEGLPYAYCRARVVFNNHLRKGGRYDKDVYDGYCNDKVFMIGGCGGGVQLMDHQPGVSPDVYERGKEFVAYDGDDPDARLASAMNRIEWVLAHPSQALAISEAARERTLREHTWRHRAEQLMGILRGKGLPA